MYQAIEVGIAAAVLGLVLIFAGVVSGQSRLAFIGGGVLLVAPSIVFLPSLIDLEIVVGIVTLLGIVMYAKGEGYGIASYFLLGFGGIGIIACVYASGLI